MEKNSTLDTKVNSSYNAKRAICTLVAGAVLGSGIYGCAPEGEIVPPVQTAAPEYEGLTRVNRSEVPDEIYKTLTGNTKNALDEKGFVYIDSAYAKKIKGIKDEAPAPGKTPEKPADQTAEKKKNWYQRNKDWVNPVAAAVAAGIICSIGEHNDWGKKHHHHNAGPSQGGKGPYGNDQGNGNDHDKDHINW